MTRTDHDSWDLASSVGRDGHADRGGTGARQRRTGQPHRRPLRRSPGPGGRHRLLHQDDRRRNGPGADSDSGLHRRIGCAMIDRSPYAQGTSTTSSPRRPRQVIRQAVILASGLDTRAYRLPGRTAPSCTRLDQPAGDRVQDQHADGIGAAPTADRRTVGIDLRDDWPTALRAAGFDPPAPTAWIAEGLLVYLPPTRRTGCSTTSPRSPRPEARSVPNMPPAS